MSDLKHGAMHRGGSVKGRISRTQRTDADKGSAKCRERKKKERGGKAGSAGVEEVRPIGT